MHSFLDSKLMAKALRRALAERDIALAHSDCLELVARQFGLADWNTLAARIAAAQRPLPTLPEGWFVSHPDPACYSIGLDPDEPGCAVIESVPGAAILAGQTGVLMQSIAAGPWRGQRLRFSAELRGHEAGRGSMWMRIDAAPGRSLRFDNMLSRPESGAVSGTTGWVGRTIVLDVPEEAASIHYGLLLIGTGRLQARRLGLDAAGPEDAVSGGTPLLPRPTNLGFAAPPPAH